MLQRLYPPFSWRVWVLVTYWLAMAIGTHVPHQDLPEGLLPTRFDLSLHLVAFLGLTLLAFWAWPSPSGPSFRVAGWWVMIVAVYAAVDEMTQLLVPGRQADLWDWVADIAGMLLGMCLVAAICTLGMRRSQLAEGQSA